jgi:hypothetical protein
MSQSKMESIKDGYARTSTDDRSTAHPTERRAARCSHMYEDMTGANAKRPAQPAEQACGSVYGRVCLL